MAYPFRYPHEKGSIACVESFNRDRRTEIPPTLLALADTVIE